jgi:hypothetical protein
MTTGRRRLRASGCPTGQLLDPVERIADANMDAVGFYTDWRMRVADTALALVGMFIAILLTVILAGGIGLVLFVLIVPAWLDTVVGVLFGLFTTYALWQETIDRLRFCVIFHTDYLQVGGGLARLDIPYQEVEVFGYMKHARSDRVGIVWHGSQSLVRLPESSIPQCLAHLRERCANAVYVDRNRREHLPPAPTNAEFTVQSLQRHYRRLSRYWACGLVLSSLLAIYFAAAVATGIVERAPPEAILFHAIEGVGTVIGATASLAAYRRHSKRADMIAERMTHLELQEDSET